MSAVTAGRDALAEVTVLLELDGVTAQGQGVSPDTMEASGRAYLRAIANALADSPVAEAEHHLDAAAQERDAVARRWPHGRSLHLPRRRAPHPLRRWGARGGAAAAGAARVRPATRCSPRSGRRAAAPELVAGAGVGAARAAGAGARGRRGGARRASRVGRSSRSAAAGWSTPPRRSPVPTASPAPPSRRRSPARR